MDWYFRRIERSREGERTKGRWSRSLLQPSALCEAVRSVTRSLLQLQGLMALFFSVICHLSFALCRKQGGQICQCQSCAIRVTVKGLVCSLLQISLDLMNSEKFVHVLSVILHVLSQMLEVASLVDIGKYAEELLSYLRSTITVEATTSVLCVQQVSLLFYFAITNWQHTAYQHAYYFMH